jgi:cytosine permease
VILADFFICRRMLKLGRTQDIEFHEGEVRRWNPCGLLALGIAVFVGALGILEVYPIYLASFVAMLLGPILHVAFTKLTGGRYYTPTHTEEKATV